MSEPNNSLISVIVPIYNVEKYLDKCVESIVTQTYKNLEIILVDDGSPDRCPEICDKWAEKDERIKVIHKKNGGLSDARNEGYAVSSGEYISFIDSDDYIDREFYAILSNALDNGTDIAECATRLSALVKAITYIGFSLTEVFYEKSNVGVRHKTGGNKNVSACQRTENA